MPILSATPSSLVASNISFWASIFSIGASIATIATLVWAFFSLRAAKKQYLDTLSYNRTLKAVDLCKHYATEILPRIEFISRVYRMCGYFEYLNRTINLSAIKCFDIEEHSSLFSDQAKAEIDKLLAATNPSDYYYNYSVSLPNLCSNSGFVNLILIPQLKNKETKIVENMGELLVHDLISIIISTINLLEQFAMYFTTDLAEEKNVFESLHQSFLDIVKYSYYFIAPMNNKSHEKYYTHLISKYNEWNGICCERQHKASAENEKLRGLLVAKPRSFTSKEATR